MCLQPAQFIMKVIVLLLYHTSSVRTKNGRLLNKKAYKGKEITKSLCLLFPL